MSVTPCRSPVRRAVRARAGTVASTLALAALPVLAALAPGLAPAATLAPGDLVVVDAGLFTPGHPILRVDPGTGTPLETISATGPLVYPHGLCVLPSGVILVADRMAGLVQVDPTTGAQSVLVPPAGFGGAGASGVAREANGNLVVVCGDASGIWRVTPAGTVLGAFADHGLFTYANAIAVAPDGGLWVADGGNRVIHVDPVSGAQTELALMGVDYETPDGIAVGPGGSPLYVLMRGRFNYGLYGGVYQVDPASGAGTRIPNTFDWNQGVAVDPATGAALVATIYDIEHGSPQYAEIVRGSGGTWQSLSPGGQTFAGPVAVVPPTGATPAVPMTWGRLKALMR